MYLRVSKGLSAKEIYSIILEGPSQERICSKRPVRVQHNATFVIDLELVNIRDLTADDNGVYIDISCPVKCHKVQFTAGKVSCVVEWHGRSTDRESDIFSLKRQYGTHKGTKEKAGVHFKRVISTVKDKQGRYMRYAVVQYFFKDSPEIPLFLTSHGNSKDDSKVFYPTTKSTLQSLKDLCKEMNPSNAYDAVHRGSGDIMSVRSISEEPRDKKQAYYSRASVSSASSFQKDEMLELHNKLRDHQEEMGEGFLREINFTDSPHAFLALEDQLDNVVRFCTSSSRFSVLGVDATFKLGDFFLTMTTFRNLMLRSRRTGKHPVFLGPAIMHMSRKTEDYLMFTQALIRRRRALIDLKAYGTDNEDALRNAFRITFANSIGLLCRIHKKENIEHHLHSTMKVSPYAKREIMHDVFGHKEGSTLHMGLYESEDDFDRKLSQLEQKWQQLAPGFFTWFHKFQGADFKECMIASVREAAQLCDEYNGQVNDFTTNDNESENFGVKQWTGFAKSSWPDFIDKLRQRAEAQIREEDKALYGSGEYQLDKRFQFLELEPREWHSMTEQQRLDYRRRARSLPTFEKVYNPGHLSASTCTVPENVVPRSASRSRVTEHVLSDSEAFGCEECAEPREEIVGAVSSSLGGTSLQETVTQNSAKIRISVAASDVTLSGIPEKWIAEMWVQAEALLNARFGVMRAAGGNENARSVASSHGAPHYVEKFANGRLACDNRCFKYKSAKICSHTLASAQDMGEECIEKFLQWRRKLKREAALTPIVVQDKTKEGAGKKSGKPTRKSGSYRAPSVEERVERIVATATSPKPWMSSSYPFEAIELKMTRARICAGCKVSFMDEEPPNGIVLKHPEKDFIAGTNRSKITPTASPRYYHVDLQCIRRRHIDWNASLHNVDCDGIPEPEKQFVFNCLGL